MGAGPLRDRAVLNEDIDIPGKKSWVSAKQQTVDRTQGRHDLVMRARVRNTTFSFLSVAGGATFFKEDRAVLSVSNGVGCMTWQLLFRNGRCLYGLLCGTFPVQPVPFQERLMLTEQKSFQCLLTAGFDSADSRQDHSPVRPKAW